MIEDGLGYNSAEVSFLFPKNWSPGENPRGIFPWGQKE